MAKPRILVIDDAATVRLSVRAFLEDAGMEVVEASTRAAALEAIAAAPIDAAIVDYMLPDGTALDLLPRMKGIAVVVLTGHGSIDLAVRAMREGAENFLTKPVELPALLLVVRRALEGRRAQRRDAARRASQARGRCDPFVGRSGAVRRLEEEARAVLGAPSPILITGPTGSGKGVLASWLHENGARAEEPFVDLNCGGLSPAFLESELFGHERGAFTGAFSSKPGLFEVGDRGTIFLDEVGDIDPAVQPKLLKVLEQRRFRRLGDIRDRFVDVRLIAATHQDLPALVRDGRFRADLYFRVNALPLAVPPLASRAEDIPDIAAALLERIAADLGRPVVRLSKPLVRALQAHTWPGNIRELRNALERAVFFAHGDVVEPSHLRLGDDLPLAEPLRDLEIVPLAENERRYLEAVLRALDGRVEHAARALGVSRSALYDRLRRHGIALHHA